MAYYSRVRHFNRFIVFSLAPTPPQPLPLIFSWKVTRSVTKCRRVWVLVPKKKRLTIKSTEKQQENQQFVGLAYALYPLVHHPTKVRGLPP